ncbi:MAG: endonuclease/exonuclease/phosphatase family protein [Bacteroidota bacterium]
MIDSRIPVIIGGDLNTTEFEPLYSSIRQGLVDVHRKAGKGFGFTFPNSREWSPWPFMRLDYIMVRGEVEPVHLKVLEESGSDHFGIVAQLKL